MWANLGYLNRLIKKFLIYDSVSFVDFYKLHANVINKKVLDYGYFSEKKKFLVKHKAESVLVDLSNYLKLEKKKKVFFFNIKLAFKKNFLFFDDSAICYYNINAFYFKHKVLLLKECLFLKKKYFFLKILNSFLDVKSILLKKQQFYLAYIKLIDSNILLIERYLNIFELNKLWSSSFIYHLKLKLLSLFKFKHFFKFFLYNNIGYSEDKEVYCRVTNKWISVEDSNLNNIDCKPFIDSLSLDVIFLFFRENIFKKKRDVHVWVSLLYKKLRFLLNRLKYIKTKSKFLNYKVNILLKFKNSFDMPSLFEKKKNFLLKCLLTYKDISNKKVSLWNYSKGSKKNVLKDENLIFMYSFFFSYFNSKLKKELFVSKFSLKLFIKQIFKLDSKKYFELFFILYLKLVYNLKLDFSLSFKQRIFSFFFFFINKYYGKIINKNLINFSFDSKNNLLFNNFFSIFLLIYEKKKENVFDYRLDYLQKTIFLSYGEYFRNRTKIKRLKLKKLEKLAYKKVLKIEKNSKYFLKLYNLYLFESIGTFSYSYKSLLLNLKFVYLKLFLKKLRKNFEVKVKVLKNVKLKNSDKKLSLFFHWLATDKLVGMSNLDFNNIDKKVLFKLYRFYFLKKILKRKLKTYNEWLSGYVFFNTNLQFLNFYKYVILKFFVNYKFRPYFFYFKKNICLNNNFNYNIVSNKFFNLNNKIYKFYNFDIFRFKKSNYKISNKFNNLNVELKLKVSNLEKIVLKKKENLDFAYNNLKSFFMQDYIYCFFDNYSNFDLKWDLNVEKELKIYSVWFNNFDEKIINLEMFEKSDKLLFLVKKYKLIKLKFECLKFFLSFVYKIIINAPLVSDYFFISNFDRLIIEKKKYFKAKWVKAGAKMVKVHNECLDQFILTSGKRKIKKKICKRLKKKAYKLAGFIYHLDELFIPLVTLDVLSYFDKIFSFLDFKRNLSNYWLILFLKKVFFLNNYFMLFFFFSINNDINLVDIIHKKLKNQNNIIKNSLKLNSYIFSLLMRPDYYNAYKRKKKNFYKKKTFVSTTENNNVSISLIREVNTNNICNDCLNICVSSYVFDKLTLYSINMEGFNRFNFKYCKNCQLYKVLLNFNEISEYPDLKKLLMDIILFKKLNGSFVFKRIIYLFHWTLERNLVFKPILFMNLKKNIDNFSFFYYMNLNSNYIFNLQINQAKWALSSILVYITNIDKFFNENKYLFYDANSRLVIHKIVKTNIDKKLREYVVYKWKHKDEFPTKKELREASLSRIIGKKICL